MTETAGYEGAGRYKTDDNIIAEIDEFGRRRIRFSPVPATETAMVKDGSVKKIGSARATKYVNTKHA